MPRIIHFEIGADDMKRAADFYTGVFNWKFDTWGTGDYWLVTTGPDSEPGINGGMMRRSEMFPPTTNVIGVPSVDEYCAKITGSGGIQVMPKSPIPGVGYAAYFKDTEGNIFGIFQSDPNAR